MNLLHPFKYFFLNHPLPAGKPLLLAVSGGVDSVVLCALCHQAKFPFLIAHGNFGLRGAESDRDEAFVRSLGEKFGVEVFVKKWDTNSIAEEKKISIQEAARLLRYEWFASLVKEKNLACTLTAHHADDNIETVLMHFFRGTGLKGLAGIPAAKEGLMRPMLNMRRKDILEFALANNLQWVEDSSNISTKYTRNYFRNELIPSLRKVYPEVEENILDNIDRFKRVNRFYQSAMDILKSSLIVKGRHDLRIPVRKLKKYDVPLVLFEWLRDFGFTEKQLPEAVSLIDSRSGKYLESPTHRLIRHRDWLILAPLTEEAEIMVLPARAGSVSFDDQLLVWEERQAPDLELDISPLVAQLDAREIRFPLVLRKWKEGDYFYPLGLGKKKKLSRFFIDNKLSRNEKEKVWVLESDQRIIWILGHRIDDRFKRTSQTKNLLVFTLSSPLYAGNTAPRQ